MKNIEFESKKYSQYLENIIKSDPNDMAKVINFTECSSVVYAISDPNDDKIVYVGQTSNFPTRMIGHCGSNGFTRGEKSYREILHYKIRHMHMNDKCERLYLESYMISILDPEYNSG